MVFCFYSVIDRTTTLCFTILTLIASNRCTQQKWMCQPKITPVWIHIYLAAHMDNSQAREPIITKYFKAIENQIDKLIPISWETQYRVTHTCYMHPWLVLLETRFFESLQWQLSATSLHAIVYLNDWTIYAMRWASTLKKEAKSV